MIALSGRSERHHPACGGNGAARLLTLASSDFVQDICEGGDQAMTRLGEEDVFVANAGELCEGPCWDLGAGRLIWVDIMAGRVHSADPLTGDRRSWDLGMPVGCVAPCTSGGWIAAVELGFARYDENWSMLDTVVPAPGQAAGTRFNDGRCDTAGRFWAGTLAYDSTPGAASLYRLDVSGEVTLVLDDVTISNGLGWSPQSDTMYYVDTGRGTVDRMRFDAGTGTPSDRTTLVSVPPAEGAPDGLAVDSEGFLWVALWDGGCVRRYSPDGELERTVRLPVSRVTSMAFGGRDLADLFITTACDGLGPRRLADEPLAGSVFRYRPGVTGLPTNPFKG